MSSSHIDALPYYDKQLDEPGRAALCIRVDVGDVY
jgi:hypothetical protein